MKIVPITRPPRSFAARIIVGGFAFALIILFRYSPRVALVHATGADYLIVAVIGATIAYGFVRLREALGAKPWVQAARPLQAARN